MQEHLQKSPCLSICHKYIKRGKIDDDDDNDERWWWCKIMQDDDGDNTRWLWWWCKMMDDPRLRWWCKIIDDGWYKIMMQNDYDYARW